MSKVIHYIVYSLLALLAWSCTNANNEHINKITSEFIQYYNNDNIDSIAILSDSILKNQEVGIAAINTIKDSIPDAYEASIAAMVTPQQAAKIILDSFLNNPPSNPIETKTTIRKIALWYTRIGKNNNILLLKNSIDSCMNNYTTIEKAKLYTYASTPTQLGKLLKNESQEKELIIAIESLYNKSELTEFRNALK